MARGNKAVLSYSKQDDVSVVPLTGWKILPRVSDSLNNTVELTDSETINDSRLKTAGMVTSANAEGDIEVEMIKGAYDDLIAAAAGNEWTTATKTKTVVFGGDVVTKFAIEKNHKDIAQYHYWSGMRVNSFSLDIPESGFIGMTFGFMGGGYAASLAASAVTPTAAVTSPKATSLSVSDIKIDGVTTKGVSCVTAFSFELNNNIERQNCLGAGLYGSNFLEMMADMTGSLTLAYSKNTQSMLDKQLTGAPVKIEVTVKFPDGDTYVLTIPKAQISGDVPSGGNEILQAQLTYTVYADAPADAPTLKLITA
nr:phage tail tube protein [uncultured Psychrobacter sp.]